MPRVKSQSKVEASSRTQDKFKRCLEALVADPEAACLGGNEFCCTGCGGNSALVDSLCAFCLHSDAARQFFADNGGLEAVFIAAASHNTEKGVLAALQILQCLCNTSHGQKLVAGQPKLLQLVCDHALQRDEDREGVQHASLLMLQSWVQDGQQNPLVSWIERYAKLNHVRDDDPHSDQSAHDKKSAVTGLQTISEEEQEVIDSVTQITSANAMPASTTPGPGTAAESTDLATGSSVVSDRNLLLQIASASLQHPTLAIRKASAHLFAMCLQSLQQPSITEAASARAKQLVLEVDRVLSKEQQAVTGPQFVAHAGGPSIVVLDPATYLREQERIQYHKQTCQALLQLASEVATTGGQLGKELLTSSGVLPCVLAIFDCAWQINTQQSSNHVPTFGNGASHMNRELLPFSFIQDHQSREMALDSLVSIFKQPGTLAALGRCVFETGGPSNMNSSMDSREGRPTDCNDNTNAESAGLARLQQSIDEMFAQPSSSHVRAALTLIGHVRFDSATRGKGNLPRIGESEDKVEMSYEPTHMRWLQQLSDVFDAAWDSEHQPDDHQVATDTLPALGQVVNTCNKHGVQSTNTDPSTGNDAKYCWPAAGLPTAGNGASIHNGIKDQDVVGYGVQRKEHPVARIELGLGCRVLVQVLQAWKSLLGLGSIAVTDVLNNTNYKQLATRALQHPKYVVASAAHKLLYPNNSHDQRVNGNPLPHNTSDNWTDWQVMQGVHGPAHMQAEHARQDQHRQQSGDAAEWTLPASTHLSDLNGLMSGLSLAEQEAAMLMEPDVEQANTGVLQPPNSFSRMSPNEELNDNDIQEFLSVFLNTPEGGEVDLNSWNTTAVAAEPASGFDQNAMHQEQSITGQQDPSTFSDPLQQSDLMLSGMFSTWGIDIDAKDRNTIEEALMLLPDLDNIAKNTTGYMRPTELAGFDDLPMMRPGGLMSPLMMFNM